MSGLADELLPCPFCGEDAGIGYGPDGPFVNCAGCLASTNTLVPHGQTEAEAIAAWNTRAALRQPAPDAGDMQGLVERLERYVSLTWFEGATEPYPEAPCKEAAAAIQSLTAERDKAWAHVKDAKQARNDYAAQLAAERAKVAGLVEGLADLLGGTVGAKVGASDGHTYAIYPPSPQAINKARALLERMK